jgi:hypothetical protein
VEITKIKYIMADLFLVANTGHLCKIFSRMPIRAKKIPFLTFGKETKQFLQFSKLFPVTQLWQEER